MNVAMALALWAAAVLPADMTVGPQKEFGEVLVTTWRIVLASVLAQMLAEFADTEVYQRFVDRFGHRVQFGRVLASNAVSVPLDSVLFCVVAFGGVFPRVGDHRDHRRQHRDQGHLVGGDGAADLPRPRLRRSRAERSRGDDQLLRPALGLRPWLAFLRRTFAFFLLVRFDIGEQP
ncbi:MAG: VUT family protein [Microthrixaceae bacterium]